MLISELQNQLTAAYKNYCVDSMNYEHDKHELKGSATEQVIVYDRLLSHALTHLLAMKSNQCAMKTGYALHLNPKAMSYFQESLGLIDVPVNSQEKHLHNVIDHSDITKTIQLINQLKNNSKISNARE